MRVEAALLPASGCAADAGVRRHWAPAGLADGHHRLHGPGGCWIVGDAAFSL